MLEKVYLFYYAERGRYMENHIPVADAHCDFLYYMAHNGFRLQSLKEHQSLSLERMEQGNVKLQFFAAWVDPAGRLSCLQQALDLSDAYWRMLDENDRLVPFSKDFSPENGKIATVLTVEGGEAIHGRLENLRLFHKLGVRAMTLTWNSTNELASPAMRRGRKGLTQLGRRVVEEMCRIGIAPDVAHLNDAGIDEVLELATVPIFASHSNAFAVCNHPRSLKDEQIRAIAKQGGVICVNFYPPQLTEQKPASIADIVKHISHIAGIAGIHAVGLGSDFDGMSDYPPDMEHSGNFPKLFDALRHEGFSEVDIQKIAYENLRNYIAKFCV
jgi:membrane dipeptidase